MLSLKEFWDATKRPLVTVTEEDSLGEAIEKLVNSGVHRLFLLRGSQPHKIITLTDLLSALYEHIA